MKSKYMLEVYFHCLAFTVYRFKSKRKAMRMTRRLLKNNKDVWYVKIYKRTKNQYVLKKKKLSK